MSLETLVEHRGHETAAAAPASIGRAPAWVRFLGLPGTIAAIIGLVAIAVALIGPFIAPYDPLAQELLARNQGASAAHWLGTDHLGRDVLSRLLIGTGLSLGVGLAGATIALAVGGAVGLAAVALGGWIDYLVFGFIDLVRAMPGVLLALTLIVALGAGIAPVSIALGLTFAPFFARVARATYRREAVADYVAAARSFGSGRLRILRRHVLPNIAGAFVTQAAIILPRCIVTESVLSFLGLGVAPDTPTWGRMIAQASRYVETAPLATMVPVIVLSLVTLSLAVVTDRLRLGLDPLRETGRHETGTPP